MKFSSLKLCQAVSEALLKGRRKSFLRIYGSVIIIQTLFVIYIEEFAMPTPDIMYDIRMKYSQEFRDFARGNIYGIKDFRRIGDELGNSAN
ncbi:unnamed protein product [Thelazia callipaeda]|uniref:ABC transporter permease n=1 Tax=Thelazia callipaeda TaxID=103827 RepID=A0A0N5D5B0_THECL|nr:unnamed protein product [Thelazia callipaeda]